MCDSGATIYRFADALSSDLAGYMSPINTLALVHSAPNLPPLFRRLPATITDLLHLPLSHGWQNEHICLLSSFHRRPAVEAIPSSTTPSHGPIQTPGPRVELSSSRPRTFSQPEPTKVTAVPRRTLLSSCPNLFCADSRLDHSRASP